MRNARSLPETTKRSASKSNARLTCAPGPRAAHPVAISAADQCIIDLWSRWREQKDAWERLAHCPEGTEEACKAAYDQILNIETVLQCDLTALGSIHALGALLLIEIEDLEEDEIFPGFYRGTLRAIRPHLAGAVAEAANRVLASVKEKEADNKDAA